MSIFTKFFNKKSLVIVFIVIFIGLPVMFAIYSVGKRTLYNVFGIKTDAEIKAEQKVVINDISQTNKEQAKVIEKIKKQKTINDNIVDKVVKQEENATKVFNNITNEVYKPITPVKEKKIINKIEIMNKKKLKKDKVITINDAEYKIEGMKDIDLIYKAYDAAKGD